MSGSAMGGLVLMGASALAIGVANSPWREGYEAFLHTDLGPLSVLHWVNDGLMAVFFPVGGSRNQARGHRRGTR
ncbi:Na+/H+ antiporter NhaA [Luteibacter sp. 621]|uniref:Na+/H+ antiporter NhaA n=1 Tax=Luteibacter sp. 621 TaxID=3373916 RepID=UPI003D1EA7EB